MKEGLCGRGALGWVDHVSLEFHLLQVQARVPVLVRVPVLERGPGMHPTEVLSLEAQTVAPWVVHSGVQKEVHLEVLMVALSGGCGPAAHEMVAREKAVHGRVAP